MADEILVHISDSTTNHKDALYRNLADEYTHFEPHTSYRDEHGQGNNHATTTALKTPIAPAHRTPTHPMLTTSKDSYGSFPSQVSSGNQNKVKRSVHLSSDPDSTDCGSTPIPNRLIQLERIQSKWKARNTPRSSFASNGNHTQRLPEYTEDDETTFIEDTQLAAQAIQSQLPEPFYFDSGDTSEDDSEVGDARQDSRPLSSVRQNNIVEEETGNVLASSIPIASNTDLPMEPSSHNAGSQLDTSDGVALEESPEPFAEDDNQASAPKPDFAAFEYSIFPPAPKISVDEPPSLPSQVTSYLAETLKQNMGRFKLSRTSLMPKADDRGCWLVDCGSWSIQLQAAFWASLSDHVVTGRLGWGTTLHRDPTFDVTLGQVRIYSWGELVEHIWLVLWLCSKGAIMSSKTNWLNADGHAIITGPPMKRT